MPEGRQDYVLDVLGPTGREEQELGQRFNLLTRVQQYAADRVAHRRATGFLGQYDFAARAVALPEFALQPVGEPSGRGGFSCTFRTLKYDKQPAHSLTAPLAGK